MKKIPLITLISFFLLIPNIDAAYKTTTETKHHYYFFSEPYTKGSIKVLEKENGSTNYTRFADYRDWETISATPVTLTYGNTVDVNSWSLDKFYAMWYELYRRGNVVCKNVNGEDTCSKDLKEKDGNWYYHFHGAHSDKIPLVGDWDGIVARDSGDNTPNDVKINNLLGDYKAHKCATLLTDNTLNRVNEGGYVVYGGTGANYNNTYISITRKAKKPEDIKEYKEEEDEENGAGPDGKIIWSGDPNSGSGHFSNCGTDKVVATDGKIYSPALYRITTTTENFKCSGNIDSPQGKCNDTVDVTSLCEKQTIEVADGDKNNPETNIARAVTSLSQDISMTNILTPTTIYQGGGVKIGFLYKAKVTLKIIGDIDYDGSSLTTITKNNLKNKIVAALESTIGNPQTTIEADNFYFKDKNGKMYNLSTANLEINCDQDSSGNVFDSNGKVVTTTCKILLPKSEVGLGSGIVKYINGAEGKGINNEFYTPIKYNGELYLHATFSGLSAIQSGDISLDDWDVGGITIEYDGKTNSSSNCVVNTYPRFYEKGNKTYKFIYRPIDIKNPFPNRNAGVNWYSWYEEPANKNRLESSYNNLDYTMIINNQKSSEIKNKYRDSYFSWRGINEYGTSEFVKRYEGGTP